MSAQDMKKLAMDTYKEMVSRTDEYARKAADCIEAGIWSAKHGYTTQYFGYGWWRRADMPELIADLVAPKVFLILSGRGYQIKFHDWTGWFWNSKPNYLGSFTLSW